MRSILQDFNAEKTFSLKICQVNEKFVTHALYKIILRKILSMKNLKIVYETILLDNCL